MKKYIYILLISLILFSCNSDDDAQNIELSCETEDLQIDELSRFSYIEYITENGIEMINQSNSYRWNWHIKNDTIEIAGTSIYENIDHHIFFKKNYENCLDFLFYRNVEFDDGGVILDDVTGEIIEHGYLWFEEPNLDFLIQEYIEDEKIVGQVGGIKFWMEFTPDVHRLIPYDYEQYLE